RLSLAPCHFAPCRSSSPTAWRADPFSSADHASGVHIPHARAPARLTRHIRLPIRLYLKDRFGIAYSCIPIFHRTGRHPYQCSDNTRSRAVAPSESTGPAVCRSTRSRIGCTPAILAADISHLFFVVVGAFGSLSTVRPRQRTMLRRQWVAQQSKRAPR